VELPPKEWQRTILGLLKQLSERILQLEKSNKQILAGLKEIDTQAVTEKVIEMERAVWWKICSTWSLSNIFF
jgi:hypothetical protein